MELLETRLKLAESPFGSGPAGGGDQGPAPRGPGAAMHEIKQWHGPRYRVGMVISGVGVQTRDRWYEFDGNQLHFTRLFKGNRCSVVCFTCKRYAQSPPEVRMQLGGAGFHFRWCNPSLQYAVTSHKVDRHSATESRDNQDHKALQAASQAAWGLLHVNSNQPGGGGVALYHHHFAKLQKPPPCHSASSTHPAENPPCCILDSIKADVFLVVQRV